MQPASAAQYELEGLWLAPTQLPASAGAAPESLPKSQGEGPPNPPAPALARRQCLLGRKPGPTHLSHLCLCRGCAGTAGWSSAVGGILNNGTCEHGVANAGAKTTRWALLAPVLPVDARREATRMAAGTGAAGYPWQGTSRIACPCGAHAQQRGGQPGHSALSDAARCWLQDGRCVRVPFVRQLGEQQAPLSDVRLPFYMSDANLAFAACNAALHALHHAPAASHTPAPASSPPCPRPVNSPIPLPAGWAWPGCGLQPGWAVHAQHSLLTSSPGPAPSPQVQLIPGFWGFRGFTVSPGPADAGSHLCRCGARRTAAKPRGLRPATVPPTNAPTLSKPPGQHRWTRLGSAW
jgi:hypothetical protein